VIRTQVVIINKLGLHARAAAKFVACTSAFSSRIQTGRDGQMIDGKSIMSVMMLAAGKGTVLDLEIEGRDEQDALAALQALLENRFDEPE
jgi:phosphocarrier protein